MCDNCPCRHFWSGFLRFWNMKLIQYRWMRFSLGCLKNSAERPSDPHTEPTEQEWNGFPFLYNQWQSAVWRRFSLVRNTPSEVLQQNVHFHVLSNTGFQKNKISYPVISGKPFSLKGLRLHFCTEQSEASDPPGSAHKVLPTGLLPLGSGTRYITPLWVSLCA